MYSRDFDNKTQMNTNSVELRYKDLPLWETATLSLMGKYVIANKNDRQKINENNHSYFALKNAWLGTAILRQQLSNGGFNDFSLQARNNSFASRFGNDSDANSDIGQDDSYYGYHMNIASCLWAFRQKSGGQSTSETSGGRVHGGAIR